MATDRGRRPARRRLTLAPSAWSTAGSRFSCLGGLAAEMSGDLDLDVEHIAVRSALEAMEAVRSSPGGSPPAGLSDEDIRQQFWVDAGFPMPASRFWERSASPSSGECSDGVVACRSPARIEPVASLWGRGRGAFSSPVGLRIARPPPRMGPWRGPLPPRRSSPWPVLATFFDRALGALEREAPVERPVAVVAAMPAVLAVGSFPSAAVPSSPAMEVPRSSLPGSVGGAVCAPSSP